MPNEKRAGVWSARRFEPRQLAFFDDEVQS